MIKHEFKKIEIAQICDTRRFAYTGGEISEEMVESVRENGLLAPPLVAPLGDKFELVAGAKRCAAARETALTPISVHVVTGEPLELLRLSLEDNTCVRPLTAGEKARWCALLLENWGMSPSQAALEWARPAGVVPQADHVAKLARSAAYPGILAALDRGAIDERTAVEALALEENARGKLLALADERIALTRSELRECIRAFVDLIAVGRVGGDNLFDSFADAFAFDGNPKARAARFMNALRLLRSPELVRRRKELEAAAKEFRKRTGVRVQFDSTLESEKIGLLLEADTAERLRDVIKKLNLEADDDLLRDLFRGLQE